MKRMKSSDDSDSCGEKAVFKDWGRKDEGSSLHRSSSHRGFYHKPESGKRGLPSPSSRHDRLEDDREGSRSIRKRSDYDAEGYERRKSYDRYNDGGERGISSSSSHGGFGASRIHRSESFSGPRREFPKGFRSERDHSRREHSVSSWRKFGEVKEIEKGARTGSDSAKLNKVALEDVGRVSSSQEPKDAKSPPCSKDSGSDLSKSVEVKNEPLDNGNNSEMEEGEMEEGELIRDSEQATLMIPANKDQTSQVSNTSREIYHELPVENVPSESGANSLLMEKIQPDQPRVLLEMPEVVLLEKPEVERVETVGEVRTMSSRQSSPMIEIPEDNEGAKVGLPNQNDDKATKETKETAVEMPQPSVEGQKLDSVTSVEVKEDSNRSSKEAGEGSGKSGFGEHLVTKELTHNFKDKGKGVFDSGSNAPNSSTNDNVPETDVPNTRAIEFFSSALQKPEHDDVTQSNKPNREKQAFEPLELSLSLPNVLLPIGYQNGIQAPGSPSRTTSVQSLDSSFRTSSDGFTTSLSFSGSQNFSHNPSCSMTQNSLDFEQSVKSRPLFQGVVWQVQSSDENKTGAGFIDQTRASQGISNGQHLGVAEGSSALVPRGLERQLSMNKHISGTHSRHLKDGRFPSQSIGSHETGSEYHKERKQSSKDRHSSLNSSSGKHDKEKQLTGGVGSMEPVIAMVVSESLHVMARKFSEMTAQSVACLKESVRDIILNPSKQGQLFAFKRALENRSDITLEMLSKSHRAQLEILVSLKTGIQDFLQRNYDIPSSDLAEIFLNLRCRNLACRSFLPVDECDCKICAQKNGFCSACMCLVCSKFDMASNTCSWVGCDVCLHWCHADCGLRESFIRNGHSVNGAQGKTEMQFHCVACDHPSEMFGFVKEVFQNFAKGWTAEGLRRELEYVRRIFAACEDVRGKHLHELATLLLTRFANKTDLEEVRSRIMRFITECDSFQSGDTFIGQGKEAAKKIDGECSNGVAGTSQESLWMRSIFPDKQSLLEKPSGLLPSYDYGQNDNKRAVSSDMLRISQREPVFDELDSIVRVKQAEAEMFQTRADNARREAESLRLIATAKNKKIDEEFMSRTGKLRLQEAEETRQRKLEELQALDRSHREFFNMKVRMEAEIKGLLYKMDATKRNFSS